MLFKCSLASWQLPRGAGLRRLTLEYADHGFSIGVEAPSSSPGILLPLLHDRQRHTVRYVDADRESAIR